MQSTNAMGLRPRRYDTYQVGQRFRRSAKTVRRWVAEGLLGAYVTEAKGPTAHRYEFDDEQLAAFERRHWRRVGPETEAETETAPAA